MKHEFDDEDNFSGNDSTTNEEWEPGSKMSRMADYKVTSPSYSSTDSNGPMVKSAGKTSNRPTGPRKPRSSQELAPEDEHRRRLRRERNKQAAAKCRQKRVDLTNTLQSETESLESEQQRLKDEIKSFQREKDELEQILNTHRVYCGSETNCLSSLNMRPVNIQSLSVTRQNPVSASAVSLASNSRMVYTEAPIVPIVAGNNGACRPNSFPTSSLRTVRMVETSTGSNVLTFGLESMLDGHTGLTPITGMPSCTIAVAGQHLQAATPGSGTQNNGLTAL